MHKGYQKLLKIIEIIRQNCSEKKVEKRKCYYLQHGSSLVYDVHSHAYRLYNNSGTSLGQYNPPHAAALSLYFFLKEHRLQRLFPSDSLKCSLNMF